MDFSFLLNGRYVGILLGGLFLTLLLAIIAVGSGTALALVPAFLRLSKNRLLRFLGTAYVEVIRGTPLLVQVLIIYSFFRMPVTVVLGIDLSSFLPGMLALFINSSAYVAEVIRGGILSVDRGQAEAAASLGMGKGLAMRKIILPQAVKNIVPALGNEFVTLIKETSIFMYLGIAELMYAATIVRTSTYAVKESYIVAAILYFCLTFPTSKLMGLLERKMKKADAR
jgi:polar amino acid transport system permease protein/polar amino acid transport system substrate-binding protein